MNAKQRAAKCLELLEEAETESLGNSKPYIRLSRVFVAELKLALSETGSESHEWSEIVSEAVILTEQELSTLIRESSRKRVVHGSFGHNQVWLVPIPENLWAIKRVKEMRQALSATGPTRSES